MRLFVESIVSGVAAMQLLFFVPTLNLMTDTLNLLSTYNITTFNIVAFNLQHCLFAVLFAFANVLFAGMKGMEIKNPRSTAWITIGFDHWIYAGLTTTPV